VKRLLALTLTACIGCSYPAFEFTSDSGAADSAVVAEVSTDTAVDTNVNDTGAVTDSDASSPPDTSVAETDSPAGCAGFVGAFCDDWDGVATPGERWGGSGSLGGGTLSLSMAAYSPPQAMLAAIASATGTTFAKVGKVFSPTTATALMRMQARVFIETSTYGGDKAILIKGQTSGGHGVGLLVTKSGFSMEVYGATYDTYAVAAGSIPTGKWIELKIETILKHSGGMYKLFVDDKLVEERTDISTTDIEEVPREFTVGFYTESEAFPYRIRFDNVRLAFP
jgi:hypothetical protein